MTDFHKISAHAGTLLVSNAIDIARYASVCGWDKSRGMSDFMRDQIRDEIVQARDVLNRIETLLNADNEAEAA